MTLVAVSVVPHPSGRRMSTGIIYACGHRYIEGRPRFYWHASNVCPACYDAGRPVVVAIPRSEQLSFVLSPRE